MGGTIAGTEYNCTNLKHKFVRYNEALQKTPMETMTRGRVYVTVNGENNPTMKSGKTDRFGC